MTSKEFSERYRRLATDLYGPDVGCGASVCVFGRAQGMTLQGPCTCGSDKTSAGKLAAMAREALWRLSCNEESRH